MRRTFALCLIALLFVAANAFAGAEARLTGVITDGTTKKPVENATVTATAVESKTFKQDFKVKKDGTYAVFLLDGTIRYKLTYSAPGYTPYEETMKLKIGGEANKKDVELFKGGGTTVPMAGSTPAAPAKLDPAVAAYNEGAQLANSGDYAGAIAKFEAAVAAKPDLTAAWIALAKTTAHQKQYKRAIEAANKALEVDDSDTDMWTILVLAYNATGDKAKAAEAQKKLPANAPSLFNEAARLINANKDAEAEPLLKQALAIDATMAQAYYELGMVYARASKNAEAKTNLEKYLELSPNGKDAATAKEMLGYLK